MKICGDVGRLTKPVFVPGGGSENYAFLEHPTKFICELY